MMKTLIMIFYIQLYSFSALAGWNWFPIGKPGAKTTYTDKAACEATEGWDCFDPTPCKGDICKVVQKMVDDLDRPIRSKSNVQDCSTEQDCRTLVSNPAYCASGETPLYSPKNNQVGFEAYCSKVVAYEKKQVKTLEVDPVLKAAADGKVAEEQLKRQQEKTLLSKDPKTMTQAEKDEALAILLKRAAGE